MKPFILLPFTAALSFAVLSSTASAAPSTKKVASSEVKPVKVKKIKRLGKYPLAYPHKPGYVISPFKPYNVLDVKHLKPGMLAYDPHTAVINPTSGKRDYSTGKIFRVPTPKVVKKTTKVVAQ